MISTTIIIKNRSAVDGHVSAFNVESVFFAYSPSPISLIARHLI